MGMLQNVLTLRCFFPLHYRMIKAGSVTAIYFGVVITFES